MLRIVQYLFRLLLILVPIVMTASMVFILYAVNYLGHMEFKNAPKKQAEVVKLIKEGPKPSPSPKAVPSNTVDVTEIIETNHSNETRDGDIHVGDTFVSYNCSNGEVDEYYKVYSIIDNDLQYSTYATYYMKMDDGKWIESKPGIREWNSVTIDTAPCSYDDVSDSKHLVRIDANDIRHSRLNDT